MEAIRDKRLWRLAKRRVAFKRHLSSYLLINFFLWSLWFFNSTYSVDYSGLPWPAWVTIGWGVGIVFNYYDAYYSAQDDAAEREYRRLAQRKNT